MRKLLALLLVGLLTLALGACGGGEAPTATEALQATEAPQQETQEQAATTGESFEVQFVCVNRTLRTCDLFTDYAERVSQRTNGQLTLQITSYPELGISGTQVLRHIKSGTLEFIELAGNFVGGDWPFIEVAELYGLFESSDVQNEIFLAIRDEEIRLIREQFNGEVIFYDYYPDQFFFSKRPLNSLEDFKGLKTRAHSTPLADLIAGLGADPEFVTFAEVYPALERGILDAGVTGSTPAHGQKWYEVTKYIVGPLSTHPHNAIVMNLDVWNKLPTEFQAILKEEGAKTEAENLRLVNEWDQEGVDLNVESGMIYSDFTPEMKQRIRESAIEIVLPNWVGRVGGPDTFEVEVFNEKVGPIVGMRINPDGTVSDLK